jgi:hypothetical protein
VNAGIATLAIGLVSLYYFRRARQSEQLNLAIVEGKRAPGDDGRKGGARSGGGHLPGAGGRQKPAQRGGDRAAGAGPDTGAGDDPTPPPTVPGRSPYRPRGRKRRS